VTIAHFDRAKKTIVSKGNSTIIDGAGESDAIQSRTKQIKETSSDYDLRPRESAGARDQAGRRRIN
jgi:hypothetical protein